MPLLAVAAAIAAMAGLNLPLAAFLLSVAVRLDLHGFAQAFPSLAPLGSTFFLIVAASLTALEFIIDRIPRLDSLWDTPNLILRPAGAAILVFILFLPSHTVATIAGLFAAAITLATHLSKAALRARTNRAGGVSRNVFISNAEDALVIATTAFIVCHSTLSFTLTVPLIAAAFYLLPKSFHSLRQGRAGRPDPPSSDS